MKKFPTFLLLMVFQLSCEKYDTRSSAEINSLQLPGSNVWKLYTEFEKIVRVCWGNHKILTHITLLKEIDRVSARIFGKKIKKACTYK